MPSTRKIIMEHFDRKGAVTVLEISHALNITPANTRHHLAILEQEGVIKCVGQRTPTRRGRPALVYVLTSQHEAHNLTILVQALLQLWQFLNPPQDLDSSLQTLAQQILQIVHTGPAAGNLSRRLVFAVNTLNSLNYQARWEARPVAPQVYLGHCPYATIIEKHPELCQMDAYLIEQLAGLPAHQVTKLEKDRHGIPFCLFQLVQHPRKIETN